MNFNRDKGYVRLMFLVDSALPRLPAVIRPDWGRLFLRSCRRAPRVKVYVVHEPVIGRQRQRYPAAADCCTRHWRGTIGIQQVISGDKCRMCLGLLERQALGLCVGIHG